MQERGAGAGGGRQESKVDAHDDHDEGQFGGRFHARTVTEDDGHEGHADGAVVHDLRERGGHKAVPRRAGG